MIVKKIGDARRNCVKRTSLAGGARVTGVASTRVAVDFIPAIAIDARAGRALVNVCISHYEVRISPSYLSLTPL